MSTLLDRDGIPSLVQHVRYLDHEEQFEVRLFNDTVLKITLESLADFCQVTNERLLHVFFSDDPTPVYRDIATYYWFQKALELRS